MRSFKILIVAVFSFLFTGCLEIKEDITVAKNGSGNYVSNIEMGQLFELIQTFASEEDRSKLPLDKVLDSTINLKDMVDTSSTISAEDKALLRQGKLHIKMNAAEKVFNLNMQYPFNSLANFQNLTAALSKNSGGMGNVFKGLTGEGGNAEAGKGPNMNMVGSYFDMVADKNTITRSLNKERFTEMLNNPQMEQLKSMSAMGGQGMEVKTIMTVHLPATAKKITGAKAKLSDDKKSLTLENNMLDVFEHPEYFEFSVQY